LSVLCVLPERAYVPDIGREEDVGKRGWVERRR